MMKMIEASPVYESTTRTGAKKFWQNHVYQDGTRYFTGSSHWQTTKSGTPSKVQFAEPYEATPKNVSRANETTARDQAFLEYHSTIAKYTDKGYALQGTSQAVIQDKDPLPMLAHKFRDHAHKVTYPCYVQPKLDGMRMLFDGTRGWSRGNKAILPAVIEHFRNIKTQGYILDGELILPGNVPLQETMSAAKKFRPGISDTLQYHVYDIVAPDKTYAERFAMLQQLFNKIGTYTKDVVLVTTSLVANGDVILRCHQTYVDQGYEGTIIRDREGKYEVGHRSYSLMKLKDFQDEEFEIVDVLEGGGLMAGQAILRVVTQDGQMFESTPQASHDARREMFVGRDDLIGSYATIKYYGKTKDGIPMFNNTIAIRDWDDFH